MIQVGAAETLALGAGGLWLAVWAHGRVAALNRWSIPKPVTGGMVLAGAVALLRYWGGEVVFDTVLRDLFTLIFLYFLQHLKGP